MIRGMENAYRLLKSPERAAFDLAEEPRESYDQYNVGRFGLGCLLARRLVEAGSRFVEVTTEYVPFEGWDTHESGHDADGEIEAGDRPADRAADRRSGTARSPRSHAGDRGQRVQPRHDDRRRARQHGEGSIERGESDRWKK